jgi:rod shape-determining protein MreC
MSNRPRTIRIYVVIFAVLILLIFLHSIRVLSPLENGLYYLFRPVQGLFARAGIAISETVTSVGKISQIKKENESLKQQVDQLMIEKSRLALELKESAIVARENEFLEAQNFDYTLARIIGLGSDPQSKVIIIDQGANDGLGVGEAVVVDEGMLIGRVIETASEVSKVLLLTDPRSQVLALIQNDNSSQGIVSGTFGLTLKMDLIPKNDTVISGQYVITSGLEDRVPKGLIIGQVESVTLKSGELFQSAQIKPIISFDQLQIVAAIKQ